jgi:rhomboid protease GluP
MIDTPMRSGLHVPRESLTELLHSSPARTPLTHAILLVNLLMFAAMLAQGAGFWHTSTVVPLAWGANFGPATQDGEWWRLFTALFIHFGLLHLGMNMWALRDVGRLVERLAGPWRFIALYVGSGILGNLLSLVVQGNKAVSGGASGAIFGLYGALLVLLWSERRRVDAAEFRWLFGLASIFIVLMLGMGWVIPGIDNAAHGGGLVSGALLAHALARPWTVRRPRGWIGPGLAVCVVLLGASWLTAHIPPPRYLMSEEVNVQASIKNFAQADQRIRLQMGELLGTAPRQRLTLEQLAGRVDSTVTRGYERSLEQLMAATPETNAPSAAALKALQLYAQQQAQASRELVAGLRTNDSEKIREALRKTQRKPMAALPAAPFASTPR